MTCWLIAEERQICLSNKESRFYGSFWQSKKKQKAKKENTDSDSASVITCTERCVYWLSEEDQETTKMSSGV